MKEKKLNELIKGIKKTGKKYKKNLSKLSKKIMKKTKTKNTKISKESLKGKLSEFNAVKKFNEILKENNSVKPAEELIKIYFVAGFSFALISVGVSALTGLNQVYSALLFFACLFFPGIMHYFFQLFLFEKNKREKENLVPDILLQASIFPKGTPITKIMQYVSESGYGLMSKEFRKAFLETEKGKTTEEALKGISKRSKSKIISRAINLLIQGNNSGAEMNKVFKEAAEDILETQSIIRERIASTLIQKYTLILAGGIIVPLLLGILTGFVKNMNFYGISELGLGMQETQRNAVISSALTANQFYIIEFALIASFFIAQQEGNAKKALIYSVVLIPLGIACYNLALFG